MQPCDSCEGVRPQGQVAKCDSDVNAEFSLTAEVEFSPMADAKCEPTVDAKLGPTEDERFVGGNI